MKVKKEQKKKDLSLEKLSIWWGKENHVIKEVIVEVKVLKIVRSVVTLKLKEGVFKSDRVICKLKPSQESQKVSMFYYYLLKFK